MFPTTNRGSMSHMLPIWPRFEANICETIIAAPISAYLDDAKNYAPRRCPSRHILYSTFPDRIPRCDPECLPLDRHNCTHAHVHYFSSAHRTINPMRCSPICLCMQSLVNLMF